ncbi:MAG: hypothetical protein IIB56_17645, partial [Planctomycetes bacterium]|nr:hypothetical protein [Planctomycetota bacterium]
MPKFSSTLHAALILLLTGFAVEARQAATAWDSTDVSDIRLISAQDAVGDGALSLGLQIRLAPT